MSMTEFDEEMTFPEKETKNIVDDYGNSLRVTKIFITDDYGVVVLISFLILDDF